MEDDRGLAILARNSICKGLKWLKYMKVFGGSYRSQNGENMAWFKILVASIKFRMPYLKNKESHPDELLVANVYFHDMCVPGIVRTSSNGFFQKICDTINRWGVRLLAGDFNMVLWMVIPVLRSKGFQANMVAWCRPRDGVI